MLGYREEIDGSQAGETPSDAKRVNLIVGVGAFGFFLLLEVLSWFTERGGVISIFSALTSIQVRAPVLDIDGNGLRFPIILFTWLASSGFCRLFDIPLDLSTRGKALLPCLVIIGGGFVLDGAFGEPIITHFMVGHGYTRCEAGDWAQGNGKSRVWFDDYVRKDVECKRRKNTVPEFSPMEHIRAEEATSAASHRT